MTRADRRIDGVAFRALLANVSAGWQSTDVELALSSFCADAVYMEPPDRQLFVGHAELGPYFAAVDIGTRMEWHGVWFDDASQTGAAEFSFGSPGEPIVDHGIVVLELRDGLIATWREYVVKGPADRAAFLATSGKTWQWHAGSRAASGSLDQIAEQ